MTGNVGFCFKTDVELGGLDPSPTALRHVPDPGNASDYMTKFVDKKKYKLSHRWATGAGSDGSRAVPNTGDGARSMWGDE